MIPMNIHLDYLQLIINFPYRIQFMKALFMNSMHRISTIMCTCECDMFVGGNWRDINIEINS